MNRIPLVTKSTSRIIWLPKMPIKIKTKIKIKIKIKIKTKTYLSLHRFLRKLRECIVNSFLLSGLNTPKRLVRQMLKMFGSRAVRFQHIGKWKVSADR